MTSWQVSVILGDDDMAGYNISQEQTNKDFFEVLKIDMNKFKSTWGLMLRI